MKTLIIFFLLVVFAFSSVLLQAQDTIHTSYVKHDVDYSITINGILDSVNSTVTDWFDITKFKTDNLILSYTYIDTIYSRSAGNDTSIIYLQGRDANLDVYSYVDTTANIVSSGITSYLTFSPYINYPDMRLYITRKNTGTHRNGDNAIFRGAIYSFPK